MAGLYKGKRFFESNGGCIYSMTTGYEVAKVSVENLTTEDAYRLVRTIIAALDKDFDRDQPS